MFAQQQDTCSKEESTNDRLVHLTVGGFLYTTTQSVLLSSHAASEKNNYFRNLLSGRWRTKSNGNGKNDDSTTLEIPDRNGSLFFYILYYLQLGELPRALQSNDNGDFQSLLPRSDILLLKEEAEYYGLEGLVNLCNKPLQILKELGSVGDIDVSPYSVIKVYVDIEYNTLSNDYVQYILKYKYNNTLVDVDVNYALGADAGEDRFSVSVLNGAGDDKTVVVNKEIYVHVFQLLQKIIAKFYCESSDKKKPTVSQVLGEVNNAVIPSALRLWWAMEVFEMIAFFDKEKSWDFEFGDKPLFNFLWWDRSWNASS